jgi:hypothetical protein
VINGPTKLQTRLLLFYSDVIEELINSNNEKFEDMLKFIKRETVVFMIELLEKLVVYYKNGFLIDDFVRVLYDKKIIAAQLDIRRTFFYPP